MIKKAIAWRLLGDSEDSPAKPTDMELADADF
jgi:hypothetical protein